MHKQAPEQSKLEAVPCAQHLLPFVDLNGFGGFMAMQQTSVAGVNSSSLVEKKVGSTQAEGGEGKGGEGNRNVSL